MCNNLNERRKNESIYVHSFIVWFFWKFDPLKGQMNHLNFLLKYLQNDPTWYGSLNIWNWSIIWTMCDLLPLRRSRRKYFNQLVVSLNSLSKYLQNNTPHLIDRLSFELLETCDIDGHVKGKLTNLTFF